MRKKVFLLSSLFFLLLPFAGKACLNVYLHNSKGERLHQNRDMFFFGATLGKWKLEDLRKQLDLEAPETLDWKQQNDLATLYIKTGEYEAALPLLEKLIQEKPDEYIINANLGTLYELMGQNEDALYYIEEGLRLNPNSHQGSEWIHVRILKAKIALQENPDWLQNNSMLDLPTNATETEATRLLKEVIFQLNTRIPFTPTPDAILEAIFSEAAKFAHKNHGLQGAEILYHWAGVYASDGTTWEEKAQEVNQEKWEVLPDKDKSQENEGEEINALSYEHAPNRTFHKGRVALNFDPATLNLPLPLPEVLLLNPAPNPEDALPPEKIVGESPPPPNSKEEKQDNKYIFWLIPVAILGVALVGFGISRARKSKR